jgi:predicted deacylase
MQNLSKPLTIAALILLVLGGLYYAVNASLFNGYGSTADTAQTPSSIVTDSTHTPTPIPAAAQPFARKAVEVIGKSLGGRDIVAHHFGTGDKELLLVGGVHGSYSANTAKVAEEVVAWLAANPSVIPTNVSVTIIPAVNPDGLAQKSMRFNGNNVDLNRNFDCDWQAEGTWQSKKVSGGTAPFSEPESKTLQNFVETYKPAAAIVFYSAAGGVYASSCGGSISEDTRSLLQAYASASGYKAHDTFDAYAVTGDMVNWFAKIGIPGISVLLTDHTSTEWTKNEKGLTAVLNAFGQ